MGRPKTGGRKKGTRNVRTMRILALAAADGITPLQVMMRTMRTLWLQATQNPDGIDIATAKEACDIAERCAPYCHAKILAIESIPEKNPDSNVIDITLDTEVVRRYAFLLAKVASEEPATVEGTSKKVTA